MFSSTSRLFATRALGLTGGLVAFNALNVYHPIFLENVQTVIVDSAASPFPKAIDNFVLVGSGVRAVTFVGFKVYAAGLYLQKSASQEIKKLIKEDFGSLKAEESTEIVNKLWEITDYKVRISPVRNTDFSHLKDGFIKLILANPMAKKNEKVAEGLDQLRDVFNGHKGSVPKGHVLLLESNGGKLSITYKDPKGTSKLLGTVQEPLVSKLLFECYLSSRKPLSDPLRKSCIEGFQQF